MRRMTSMALRCFLLCMPLIFGACEHKDLCYDHEKHAPTCKAVVNADYVRQWQHTMEGATDWRDEWPPIFGMEYDELLPAVPEGLRVLAYNSAQGHGLKNLPPGGGTVSLSEGPHSLLFYNNDTEYVVFNGLESFATASATTRTRSRSSYLGNPYSGTDEEKTVNQPDMLFGNYRDGYEARRTLKPDTLDVTMHPLVFTYLVRYEFTGGLEYVSLARGALAGMAGAVYLNSGRTSAETVTVLYDCTRQGSGVQAPVRSFGVPDYPNPDYTKAGVRKYALNLEVRLKNGKMKSFDFDITDQIEKQPRGGIIWVGGIEITEEEGTGGNAGFDVDVDDWGEYEDIELPLVTG